MKLSMLETGYTGASTSQEAALLNVVQLATVAESSGLHRFWVGEHHLSEMHVSASPLVLASFLAASTSSIRIGAGTTLLRYRSPLRVAESASALAVLANGRFDLGVSRGVAGPTDVEGRLWAGENDAWTFENAIDQLRIELSKPEVSLRSQYMPAVWILGTSEVSKCAAARFDLPYAHGLHLDLVGASPADTEQSFRPDLVTVPVMLGTRNPQDQSSLADPVVRGSADHIAARLNHIADTWCVGEVMLVICNPDFDSRVRCIESIAARVGGQT